MKRQIKELSPHDLVPYERNSRTHSGEQIAQLVASINEFGFINPVLIDEHNRIIAGHGRVMAAKSIGMEAVPCLSVANLTEAQVRAYVIADNKLAENAGWDEEILRQELLDLQGMNFDLGLIGFGQDELAEMLEPEAVAGLTDPDDVPEVPVEPVSRPGDIWLLGNHRLMCGDSTLAVDVARLLRGGVPHLMVTDPPYGVEYDASWRGTAGIGSEHAATGKVLNDHNADWREAWALFPGDVAYVWHAGSKANIVADSLAACGFSIYSQIIWAKNNIIIGRGHYHPQHEPCWYAVRKGKTGHWCGSRKEKTIWRFVQDLLRSDELLFVRYDQDGGVIALSGDESTVWEIPKPLKSETGHSTQKPVECMSRPIRNNSRRGDAVYEPFSGSGTTIIAAEQTGRRCYAMELSPAYVDVAVKRWENFTGRTAELERR